MGVHIGIWARFHTVAEPLNLKTRGETVSLRACFSQFLFRIVLFRMEEEILNLLRRCFGASFYVS
jgi:hypothetical protein